MRSPWGETSLILRPRPSILHELLTSQWETRGSASSGLDMNHAWVAAPG